MELRRMSSNIAYHLGINPYQLDDDEFILLANGLEYVHKKQSERN